MTRDFGSIFVNHNARPTTVGVPQIAESLVTLEVVEGLPADSPRAAGMSVTTESGQIGTCNSRGVNGTSDLIETSHFSAFAKALRWRQPGILGAAGAGRGNSATIGWKM